MSEDFVFQWADAKPMAEPAPEGIYDVEFQGTQSMPKNELYGDGVMFKFVVVDGEHRGKSTSNIGKPTPTESNISGRLIRGLVGKLPTDKEKISLKECIGKRYVGVVQKNKNGRPVITTVQKK
jgi:hypothetical protein